MSIVFKGWSGTKKFFSIYPCPALLTLLPIIPFTNEEISGCTNEAAKGANKAPRSLPSCFFISCFTVSVTPSINTPKSCNSFIILIILFLTSFESKFFSCSDSSFSTYFCFKFIAFVVELLSNPFRLSLAKGIAIFVSAFFPKLQAKGIAIFVSALFRKLPDQEEKDPPD